MGATHLLCMTLPKVATEMALNVLAYNMKRVMRILGVGSLLQAMRARMARARSKSVRADTLQDFVRRFVGLIWCSRTAGGEKWALAAPIQPTRR